MKVSLSWLTDYLDISLTSEEVADTLTALGIDEIDSEIKKLANSIINFEKILKSKKELLKVIKNELNLIKNKFAEPTSSKNVSSFASR